MALPPRERAFVYASIDLQLEREKKALRSRMKSPQARPGGDAAGTDSRLTKEENICIMNSRRRWKCRKEFLTTTADFP